MRKVFTVPLTLGLLASGIVVYSLWQPSVATLRRKNPSRIFDRAKQHPRASLFASTD